MSPFKKNLWWILLTVISGFEISSGQFHPEFCTKLPANLTQGPTLPILSDQYFTTAEWRQMSTGRSVFIQEFFDQPGQRAVVKATGLYDPGETVTNMNYYNTNERIFIQGSLCTTDSLDSQQFFGFPYTSKNKTAHLLNANDALDFGRSFNETYIGTDVIRDIPVNHWRSCGYNDFLETTVEIDFYFSIPDKWQSASGVSSVPVRSVIRHRESTTTLQPMETIVWSETEEYDYLYYQEGLPADLTVFQIPEGIYCRNRPNGKTAPELGDYFSFKAEVTFSKDNVTGIINEWYDYKAQVVRVDSENIPSPFIVTAGTLDPLQEIHDFFSGLSYNIDRVTGECHVTPIKISRDFDVRYIDPNHVAIKTPQQFFDLGNKNFQYIGQRSVRDIPCDVWIATRSDFPPHSNESTTWEWYFSHGNWKISQGSGNHIQRPLKIVITFVKNKAKIIYNIFDFETKRPEITPFNVHSCYNETDIRYVRLNFTGPIFLVSPHPDVVRQSVHVALQKVMKVSLLRILGIQTVFDNYGLYIGFVLFGPPEVDGDWTGNITSLDDAFLNLKNITDRGSFQFGVTVTEDNIIQSGHFQAVPHSVRVAMKDDNGDIVDIIMESSTQQTMTSEATSTKRITQHYHSHKTSHAGPTPKPSFVVPITGSPKSTPLSSSQTGTPSSKTGLGGGAVAAIAIAMVIIGTILGVVGTFLYTRKKNLTGFEMSEFK